MINGSDFLKWLQVFNVPYGGGQPGSVTQKEVQESAFNFQLAAVGSANDAFIVNLNPAVTSLTDGLIVTMNSTTFENLTTTPTLQINALAPKTISLWGGTPLLPGDISPDSIYLFLYNLTDDRFELINPSASIADTSSVQGNLYNANVDIGVADAYEVNLIPAYTNNIYPNGFTVFFKAENSNTGASTLTTNGNAYPIKIQGGAALVAGDMVSGNVYWLVFNNTAAYWVLMNPEVLRVNHGGTGSTTVGAVGTLAQSDGSKYTFTQATYPSTATSTGTILRADGANWVATTATYPNTTSINQVLYSSANNTIAEISAQKNAVLVSNNSNTPSWSSSLTDGQIIIGKTNDIPAAASISGGGSVTVTPGPNSLTISSSASGVVNAGLINQLAYYAANGSTVSGLTTANNGILVTSAGGVPSIGNSVGADLTINTVNVGLGAGNIATNNRVGVSALSSNTTGARNVAEGYQAAATSTTANDVTAIGYQALNLNTVANNTAVGSGAMDACTTGTGVAVGKDALGALTTGAANVAVGTSALSLMTTATNNTAVGHTAAQNNTANGGTFIGYQAGFNNTSGIQNVAVGAAAGGQFRTGSSNTAVGTQAMGNLGTSAVANCVFMGQSAGISCEGNNNTGIGYFAGNSGATGAVAITTGTSNTLLGYRSSPNAADAVGTIGIGANAVPAKATGVTSSDAGAGIAIGSATFPVGFRGDGTIYTGGTGRGYWKPKINGTDYFLPLFVSGTSTANACMVTDANGSPILSSSLTDGQLIIGSTGSTPVAATLTAGANISILNTAGNIEISSTGGTEPAFTFLLMGA